MLTIQKQDSKCFVVHNNVKYNKSWCNTCGCYSIDCPLCKNSSCTGGGCSHCNEVFKVYISTMNNFKNTELVEHYKDLDIEFVVDSIRETKALIESYGPEGTLVERVRILEEILEEK